jgi:hypothetical protein
MTMTDHRSHGRNVREIVRDIRKWAREERARNGRIATALDDFAAALEQRARLLNLSPLSTTPTLHDAPRSHP